MGFWFQPTRTAEIQEDLHHTDVKFLRELLGTEYVTFGSKGIASTFCDVLPGFRALVNKWASPEMVENWGKLLLSMDYHFHAHTEAEKDDCYFHIFGQLFIKIGRRGIGLILSW